MNIDKIRAEFEDWIRVRSADTSMGFYPKLLHRCSLDDDIYMISWVDSAWEGWQASRDSLVIELPAENPLGSGPGDCEGGLPSFEQHCAAECNFILRDCREAIEAAGVKVKP
jgi:hypothetical protein